MEVTPKKSVVAKSPAKKRVAAAKPHTTARKPRVTKPHTVPAVEPGPETVLAQEVKAAVPKSVHGKNFYGVGRRKTAVAQILASQGDGTIIINQLPLENYFQTADLQQVAKQPLVAMGLEKQINVKGKIHGGGIHAQAEALRHALARCLISFDPESRRTLKKLGFLTRDPRVKERKKPGLKRARRAPQFSKR
jgi:small subunit ribosomal protein S9